MLLAAGNEALPGLHASYGLPARVLLQAPSTHELASTPDARACSRGVRAILVSACSAGQRRLNTNQDMRTCTQVLGERVPYVIVQGCKGAKAFEKVGLMAVRAAAALPRGLV